MPRLIPMIDALTIIDPDAIVQAEVVDPEPGEVTTEDGVALEVLFTAGPKVYVKRFLFDDPTAATAALNRLMADANAA